MGKLLTETIGTFFLVLAIAMTGNPLYIGFMLMVMVYMGGPISGAHFNPAVTLGVRLCGKISWAQAGKYMAAQMAGAILAGVIAQSLMGDLGGPEPAANHPILYAYAVEALFTFALVLVVLNVGVSERAKGNQYFGAAIGLTVAAAAAAGGPISGGAFNPAVGVGLNLVRLFQTTAIDAGILNQQVQSSNPGAEAGVFALYLIGPVVGALLAVQVFKIQEAVGTR